MTVAGRETIVLLVEDNPADECLVREALTSRRNGWVRTESVGDGEEALLFLSRRGRYGNAPKPDLIMLDLSLPKRGGVEVLGEIRNNPATRRTPVVVLTGSATNELIEECYSLGANCVVPKGQDLDDHVHVLELLCDFWLTAVMLPRGRRM